MHALFAPRAGVRASGTVCALGYEGRHAPQGCSTSRLGNSRHQAPATLRHTDPNVSPTRRAQRRALTPPRKSALRCTPGRWATWHSDEEVPQAQPQRLRPRQPPAGGRSGGTRGSYPARLRARTRPGGAIRLLSAAAAPTKLPPSPAPLRTANPGRARAPPPRGSGVRPWA